MAVSLREVAVSLRQMAVSLFEVSVSLPDLTVSWLTSETVGGTDHVHHQRHTARDTQVVRGGAADGGADLPTTERRRDRRQKSQGD